MSAQRCNSHHPDVQPDIQCLSRWRRRSSRLLQQSCLGFIIIAVRPIFRYDILKKGSVNNHFRRQAVLGWFWQNSTYACRSKNTACISQRRETSQVPLSKFDGTTLGYRIRGQQTSSHSLTDTYNTTSSGRAIVSRYIRSSKHGIFPDRSSALL